MPWEYIKSQAGKCNHATHQWLQGTMFSLENHGKKEPEKKQLAQVPKRQWMSAANQNQLLHRNLCPSHFLVFKSKIGIFNVIITEYFSIKTPHKREFLFYE